MGLKNNPHNSCVYSDYICDPDDPADLESTIPFTLGLYIDDLVYASCDNEVKAKVMRILSCHICLS